MTTTLKVRYDGKVLVPEGPVDLPVGPTLEVQVTTAGDTPPLLRLAQAVGELPSAQELPRDGAAQHDHYIHGMPKKP